MLILVNINNIYILFFPKKQINSRKRLIKRHPTRIGKTLFSKKKK